MKEKKTLEELIQDYNECKEKYSSLVNDVEDKLIRGEYKDIELPFSNMNTNNLNRDASSLEKFVYLKCREVHRNWKLKLN